MKRIRCTAFIASALILSACSDQHEPATVDVQVDKTQLAFDHQTMDVSGFSSYLELKFYTDVSLSTHKAQELDAKLSVLLYYTNDKTLTEARIACQGGYDVYLAALMYSMLSNND